MDTKYLADESIAKYTTRLLSGSVYRRGIYGAFELLRKLRRNRYKAKSPESRLDLDQIMLHAVHSVTVSVMFATAAIILWITQFLLSLYVWDSHKQIVLINLAGAIIVAYELIYLRWKIAREFITPFYNPNFQPKLPLYRGFFHILNRFFKRQIIETELNQNVVTFGRYQPFLGAGGQISQWTFAIDRKPPEDEREGLTRIDIPVEEFYQASDQEITDLSLPNLEHLSRLFVDGSELEVDGKILINPESPPKPVVSEKEIWALGQHSLSGKYRAYRLYRYTDIEHDQVFSYFLRFYNLGSITFVESSAHILPSIDRQRFSLQPVLKNGKVLQFTKMILVVSLFFWIPRIYAIPEIYVLVALVYVGIFAWNIISWRLDDRRHRQAIKFREEYNYGHTQTFRESISAKNYQSYYGVQDLTMYWKSINTAIFASLIRLLKRYGVDTSQFEEAAKTIINTGVMVSGGNFSATQVAAGVGATTVQGSNLQQQAKNLADRITSIPKSSRGVSE